MRFVIAIATQLGLWFLFCAAYNPEFMSPQYWLALVGCMLIGIAVGLLVIYRELVRKESARVDAKEDADRDQV